MLADLQLIEASDYGVKVGFRTERSERIARYHEEGTRHMPRRPFVGLTAATKDRIVRFLKQRMGKG